ncbi:hypothetical protein JY651_14840 [Pyxidicoccus parkwayensis]|uniref:SH3b domain-containing protein n=1 Tax=Pyxidicoccus parkwayensis TaxID=2813578 RepID=A0ABX7P6L6_9BACT|nr:hypothetical protein [Pyxidicoccus parkwaysis]QSQ26122.1 hypothetical protein JY651_14840 [Pyxidicoccus parkwaysis]
MTTTNRKVLPYVARAVLVGLFAVGAWQAFKVTPAYASTRLTVCAQDLYVRDAPAGIFIGTLYQGQTMEVTEYSPSGQWAYGFAYGHVNKWGWVQNGWFCK